MSGLDVPVAAAAASTAAAAPRAEPAAAAPEHAGAASAAGGATACASSAVSGAGAAAAPSVAPVGGAGTADSPALDVPMLSPAALREAARAADTLCVPIAATDAPINVDVLEWALEAELQALATALAANKPAADALETRLRDMHTDAMKLPPAASASRLHLLRVHGSVLDTTAEEREYAALFEPLRTAQQRVLDGATKQSPLPMPAVETPAGRYMPSRLLAGIVPVDLPLLIEGVAACKEVVDLARTFGTDLAAHCKTLGDAPGAVLRRLRSLQIVGPAAVAVATDSEKAYSMLFEPVREFRRVLRAALADSQVAVLRTAAVLLNVLVPRPSDPTAVEKACSALLSLALIPAGGLSSPAAESFRY